MAAPMKVTHKLLKGSSTSSGTVFWGVLVHVIRQIRCQVNIDYHNQHESAVLISLFHATSSVLPSVESYRNYRKPREEYMGTSPLCSGEYKIIGSEEYKIIGM